ncbi:MAG: M16 family metallopeptidase, partial [Thermoguttaceae bacterium]
MHTHILDNGMVLLAESMNWAESVSWSLLIPCGPVLELPKQAGISSLLCEMTLRGSGNRSSREFMEAIENIGGETAEAVANLHTGFGASLLACHLHESLDLLADQVRRPLFPEDQLEAAKQILRLELYAIEDDPAGKVHQELHRLFFPDPWGRSSCGEMDAIDTMNIDDVRRHHSKYYQPNGAILSVAGKLDWDLLRQKVESLFADWMPQNYEITEVLTSNATSRHFPTESAQTHIGIAYPTIPLCHPDSLLAWSCVSILSGGMSSRLFTELREKRGLCYTVHASYISLRDMAGVFCYCGTSCDRAEEAKHLLCEELSRLKAGIESDELMRLKTRTKSLLVMQQESTASRS